MPSAGVNNNITYYSEKIKNFEIEHNNGTEKVV